MHTYEPPDPLLTSEQRAAAATLTSSDLHLIDRTLLSHVPERWRKVAMVVAQTLFDLEHQFPAIPHVYYAARIKALRESGLIESQGDLSRMRYSEVRLCTRTQRETTSA